jgi:hypothetical protein
LCYLLEGRFEEAVKEARQDSAVWAQLLVQSLARLGRNRCRNLT